MCAFTIIIIIAEVEVVASAMAGTRLVDVHLVVVVVNCALHNVVRDRKGTRIQSEGAPLDSRKRKRHAMNGKSPPINKGILRKREMKRGRGNKGKGERQMGKREREGGGGGYLLLLVGLVIAALKATLSLDELLGVLSSLVQIAGLLGPLIDRGLDIHLKLLVELLHIDHATKWGKVGLKGKNGGARKAYAALGATRDFFLAFAARSSAS